MENIPYWGKAHDAEKYSIPHALTEVSSMLLRNVDLTSVVQGVVDEILKELVKIDDKYKIIVLSLIDGEYLKRISLTLTDEAKIALEKVEIKFKEIIIPMSFHANLGVKVIMDRKPYSTSDFADILIPALSVENARYVQQAANIKTSMVFPVFAKDEAVGSMIFSMNKDLSSLKEDEILLIENYLVIVGIAIQNAKLFAKNIEIQQNLKKALDQISEARRRERDMIDIMGHELRTPMSIVKNALSFMDMQLKNNNEISQEKVRKYVDIGLESARRETNLIETMLSATKADAKGFDLTFEKVDLNDVIEDSLTGYKRMAINKGLNISFETQNPDNLVYCDRIRIQEISDNFISNAVKYTESGFVKIYIEQRDNMLWTTVEDSGIGISEDELKLLGKKFFRAHQHLQDDDEAKEGIVRPGGTGLGLYVSFALCKLMDGDYKVESVLGTGSKFMFGMPIYTNQQPKSVQRSIDDYIKDKVPNPVPVAPVEKKATKLHVSL